VGLLLAGKVDAVKELFATPLGNGEAAFMYLGYSGVVVRTAGGVVAFDVADFLGGEEIGALERLDLLLFTHNHHDHYARRVAAEVVEATGARVVAEPLVAGDLKGAVASDRLTRAEPGRTYVVGGFEVAVVGGVHFGPVNLYRVRVGGLSLFHAGDSGYVSVKDYSSDLAFLPAGTSSPTASPKEAFRLALDLRPRVAVPFHCTMAEAEEFRRSVGGRMPETKVVVPKPYSVVKLALKGG